ncbi:MAG TPA: FG-GAP-like repeat-containing protein [Vicinamibacterales bacterium]
MTTLRALVLVAAAFASAVSAQSSSQQALAEANGKMQSRDFAGAVTLLERVTAAEPSNVRAWRMFGVALQQNNELDRAIDAYKKALALQPDMPVVLFNIGTAYARKKDADRAFEYLAKARATKKFDMTQMQVDADLAPFTGDPRFAELLPKAADFTNPFVEDARIIREWDGEALGDQFGWIARDAGDIDKDGVHDVVTSAPTKVIGGGAPAGRIYVYSTKTGALLWKADGKPGDTLGIGVESAGDTNKDGVPDVVASAPGDGYASIYSGKDGAVLRTFKAEEVSDAFGRHVSGVGDVNKDGAADVIVGAPANNAGGKGAGRAYVYSGADGKLLLTLTGERAGDGFGAAVAGYSDGKHTFLIVGAPTAGAKHTGRTYVYDSLSTTPKFVADADDTGAALGAMFLSVPGDLNRDGTPDIYATDFPNAAKGPSTGRAYVYSGTDGKPLLTLTGETPGEGFGIGAATMGDANGDGVADLIVGAWQHSAQAASAGRAYLYSGKDGALLRTITGRIPGETFGFDAVGIGDVNGDGLVDLLMTSAWSGIAGNHSGRMFVIAGTRQ